MSEFPALLYCPQSYVSPRGYVIVHVVVFSGVIFYLVVFSNPCYRPQSYVIVHKGMLSSTELCFCLQGYVIVHRAMLSSMWWYYQTHVIFHRAMLLSTGVKYVT